MKRSFTLVFAFLMLLNSKAVHAQDFESKSSRAGNNIIITANETIDRSFFATGDTVTISGTINGDLYAVGGTIFVNGTINGDLLAAGGVINVMGEVSQDIRVAGGQITIGGSVGQNITMAGGNLDILPSADIQGSIVAAGGNLIISSPIQGNINAGVGNLTLSESVQGDIEAAVGNMTLTPQAAVSGDLNYWSDQELNLAQGASVSGRISRNDPEQTMQEFEGAEQATEAAGKVFLTTGRIVLFLSLLIIGALLIWMAPNYTKRTSDKIAEIPLKAGLIGFLALVVTPLAAVLLMITLIGLPLGLILLATYFVYLYISKIFFIYWVGGFASEKLDRNLTAIWVFVLGIVIYAVIALIPIVGGLMRLVAMLLGLGAMIVTCKETYNKLRTQKLI